VEPVDAAVGLFDKRFDPRALVIPRRDGKSGISGEAVEPSADAAAGFEHAFAKSAVTVEQVLGHSGTADDLAEAVREPEFGDLAAMTPQQAAIAAALVLYDAPRTYEPYVLVDAWVATRGVPFATAAMVGLGGFGVWILQKGQKAPALRRKDHDTANPQERFAMAARMRRHLAAASEDDYATALAEAGALRGPAPVRNAFVSFLFPERTDWVDEDIAGPLRGRWEHRDGLANWLLMAAVTTPEQAERLAKWVHADALRLSSAATATLLATVGLDLVPAIATWAEDYWEGVEPRQRVQRLLAGLDSDDAFRALLGLLSYRGTAAVLAEAAHRFPERGVRLLAEEVPEQAAPRTAVERVLRLHVTSRPDVARAVAPQLGAEARARVEKVLNTVVAPLPLVAPDVLPDLLVTPPWEQERENVKPVIVKGLTVQPVAGLVWLSDQERVDWLESQTPSFPWPEDRDWDKLLAKALGRRHAYNLMLIVVHAPEEPARRALRNLSDGYSYDAFAWASVATARFGMDAFPAVMNAVRNNPAENAGLLAPFACSEIAPLAADWNLRLKSLRSPAQAWLRRHPALAARTLIPAALGKSGRTRQAAEAALRFLAAEGLEQDVRTAATSHGSEAEAGVVELLAQDPLLAALPKTMPDLPGWAEPEGLPQLLLAGRKEALPPAAVRNVVRMLMLSTADDLYPGLEVVKELCDARSSAEFCWGLFENWQTGDYPAKQSFAMDALRWFGDDQTVRRLSPLIRVWPGDGGHARAIAGLDVLTAIGGDTALLHLYGISQKGKFRGLKENAQERVAAIAKELRLIREQLGDRLVPDLGLDDSGSMELDYGPRRFRVFFDEQLKPGVTDETGKRLKSLPKPGVKDDAELAPEAYQRFSGLKKDVRTLASDQISRLELAMVTRRRWTKADFEEYFVGHPLLRHLVRRLVWSDYRPDGGGVRAAFRVAEDLSYADVEDDPHALPDDALIGVAHPVDLGADLPRWSELFADYEMLQPFQQLGRAVHTLTAEEAESSLLTRYAGVKTPAGKVLGLERRGWERSAPADGGWQGYLLRELPGGDTLVVELEPGFSAGAAFEMGDQELRQIWIGGQSRGYTGYWRHSENKGPQFSTLDPVTVSEILRDLSEVTGR
jgi:hypothetical protein